MTWLAPTWLFVAAAASAAVVLLHFLARRRPAEHLLPTTRVVPVAAARATTRAVRPTDLLLLALRVLLVMLIGAAFARPVFTPEKRARASVVLADRSRAVRDIADVRGATRAAVTEGDVVIAFDSAPRRIESSAVDSAAELRAASRARGSLSAALVAGIRAGDSLRAHADVVNLVVVSPLAREELDAATDSIRLLWRGPIRLVSVAAAEVRRTTGVEMMAAESDPVRAGVALAGLLRTRGDARVVRNAPTAADSSWAHEGRVLVHWPRAIAPADTEPALLAGKSARLITPGPFLRQTVGEASDAIAWWIDGSVAVRERALGAGCVRDVGADPGLAGDVVLRPSFGRLVAWLAAPCGHTDVAVAADSVRIALSEAPDSPLTASTSTPPREAPLARWLFAAAAMAAALEPLARRRERPAAD